MYRKIILLLIVSGTITAAFSAESRLPENLKIRFSFKTYDTDHFNKIAHSKSYDASASQSIRFEDSEWNMSLNITESPGNNAAEIEALFICTKGQLNAASVAVDFIKEDWSESNYILVPAALYNGNRYPWRRIRYSPKLMDPRDIGPEKGIILSDVPKLNHERGPSFVQLRSGAMATPAVCFHDSMRQKGFILLTTQATSFGDNGIYLEENQVRDQIKMTISAPVVREIYKYHITDSRFPSDDKPANFVKGDSVIFKTRIYYFDAPELQVLFDMFAKVRKDFSGEIRHNNVLPFSEAYRVQEEKFNRDNWVEEHGYYSVGMRENFLQDWQIGWTGGMISTYPLLHQGNKKTVERVIRNFNWLFPKGISPSGFFWDSGEKGTIWYGGDIRKPHTANWHLIRKSGDGLYYIIKQFDLMKTKGIPIQDTWEKGVRTVAQAFVQLWTKNGQLGQFIDSQTGEIRVGGSTSGAIVPAALVAARDYFNEPDFLKVAEEIGKYYYGTYTKNGLTCGGPGDAMQNFDSESAYALVESYFALYEATQDKFWLKASEEAAKQFSTWVMSYNFDFPPNSTYGKLGIEAPGAVFANTQNTHGSPGICTHSGWTLLKLYRATGNDFYLDLLKDITHAIPQCLAHPQRKMPGVKNGWINERINTTDWLEGIGEIMYGSTWAETSLMLTNVQVPGLYVVPDKELLICFDNLEAKIKENLDDKLIVELINPTSMDANVKVWQEKSKQMSSVLKHYYLHDSSTEIVPSKSSRTLIFHK